MDIFKIPRDSQISKDQVNEVWFAFNMLANFIFNKNLTEEGNPKKFIKWVTMVQCAYPTSPYMNLFLAIAHVVDESELSIIQQYYKNALESGQKEYWQKCFKSFGILDLLNSQPTDKKEVIEFLSKLKYEIITAIK